MVGIEVKVNNKLCYNPNYCYDLKLDKQTNGSMVGIEVKVNNKLSLTYTTIHFKKNSFCISCIYPFKVQAGYPGPKPKLSRQLA